MTPYRGAGRQHGVFVVERLLDIAARDLDIDRAEIRRRNFTRPDAFPYDNQIIYQDFAPLSYDSGNYEPILDKALAMIDYAQFIEVEQPRARTQGRRLGVGIAAYVEGTGIGPYEGARVQVQANGKVSVATGIGTQGQGHFTSFAQIVADEVGVEVTNVDVVTGDTDQFYWGAATSRGAGAPVELVGIAGHHIDVRHLDADFIGDDLRKAREMALPLGADAGRDAHLAVGLNLDPGALVGADAGAFHVGRDADAETAALRPRPRLLHLDELRNQSSRAPCRGSARNCRCRRRAARNPGK